MALPGIFEYLESRMQPVQHSFDSKTEHGLNEKHVQSVPSLGDYALLDTQIWVPESFIRSKVFDPTKPL